MEQFIALIQGPAAATVLMAVIIATAYKFIINYIIPRVDAMLKDSNERYREMMAEHKEDRAAWLKSIDKITHRLDRMSELTDVMSKSVDSLHNQVAGITQQLQDDRKP
jgi:hypothetical protein